MTKNELKAANAELISLLAGLREQIDDALAELGIEDDVDDYCDDDGSD